MSITKIISLFAVILFLGGCAELQKNAEQGLDNVSDIPDKIWGGKSE